MYVARPMIFQPAVIPAQLLFDMQHRLIGTFVSIRRISFRAQCHLGVEVQRALGAKARTFAFDDGVAGITAIEIFVQRTGNARLNSPAQGVADIEMFSGNAKRQG